MKGLLLTLGVIIGGLSLSSCSSKETFIEKSYEINKEEIKNLTIELEDREVEVKKSETDKVAFTYFDSNKESLNFLKDEENETLNVSLSINKEWTDFIGVKAEEKYRKVVIEVPDNYLEDLFIKTTNENILISSLSFLDEVNCYSNNGDIIISELNTNKAMKLETKNGNISGTIVGSYDEYSINCSIKKGNTNLPLLKEDGEKELVITVNNGDANLKFVK